ncbi:hypothetical protein CVT26_015302 [Gymnopilus dilepis]|uniref:CENP-V/GFA domain-containing protein n=1 Tax=Gymnopilus dilepis TaxID=231916 RepID=A0A409YE04_9AGAR|nr:hypothetical protein CVT26_015302 [Gymnopilus dilepis]
MSAPQMNITLINASCHCASNRFKVAFSSSSLPIASELCHCNTCRHSTGTLFIHSVPIIGAPLPPEAVQGDVERKEGNFEHLKTYTTPSGSLTRYFCDKCFCYMFCKNSSAEASHDWNIYTGALQQVKGIVRVGAHRFVESTLDGGIANHYPIAYGVELPRYRATKNEKDVLPLDWKAPKLLNALMQPFEANTTLSAYCDCKTINLIITRATTISRPRAQWWLIPPKDNQSPIRYLAAQCTCDSCRLVNGSLVTSWVYVYRDHVIDANSSLPVVLVPKEGEARTPGLVQYESSPGVFREACATCGAKVFYWSGRRKGGPNILDIAAGLIDQEQDGARADEWFAWADKIPQPDNPIDDTLFRDLERGLKAFGCYPVDYKELRKPEEDT